MDFCTFAVKGRNILTNFVGKITNRTKRTLWNVLILRPCLRNSPKKP